MQTAQCLALWLEARTRFSNQLKNINESDLTKKLGDSPNSAGFLLRHIGEVELLFAKNTLSLADVEVVPKTLMAQRDTGEWTNLDDLLAFLQHAYDSTQMAILAQQDADWQTEITSEVFGTKTKAETLGRIISHTAYHGGQLAAILKYGK